MNRWNIVREKRKDVEEIQRQEQRKQLFKFWWIRKILAVNAIKSIFDTFDTRRKQIYQGYKEKLLAKRIIRIYNQQITKRGESYGERILSQIRCSSTACMTYMKDICDQRSKDIISSHMEYSSMNYFTKNKFIEYSQKIGKIQQKWFGIKRSQEHRFETMIKLWERETQRMTSYWIKHKNKNKKCKALLKKLQVLEPQIRDKLVQYYLQKCTHQHAAFVYEWVKNRTNNPDINFKSDDAMEFRMMMVSNMNKFLYKGVDNSILDLEFKKEQKLAEKSKQDNKHGDGHTGKTAQVILLKPNLII